MAWKDSLQDASFRGVPFACRQVGRAGRRAVAIHEVPYRAGAELEDLNIGPRQVRLQALFWGDDYEAELAAFIEALEAPGTGELVHPIHGAMTVLAGEWEDLHSAEEVDSAMVEVTFVEDAVREIPVFSESSSSAQVDAIGSGADDVRDVADEALARFCDFGGFDVPRIPVLQDAFRQARGFVGRILTITGSARLLLSDLDPLLYPRAYAADLRAQVDRAFQGLPFGGRNMSYDGPQSFKPALVSAVVSGVSSSVAAAGAAAQSGQADFQLMRGHLDPASIVLTPNAPVATTAMKADVAVVQAHAQAHAAAAIAEAVSIVLAGELDVPLLNRGDIERLTGQTRAALQVAINTARGALDAEARGQVSTRLAALAWSVQEAARAVVNQRPPLTQRAAPVSGPLRLVAHAMYGQAGRAVELAALNALGRKVLIDRGDVLYAYTR